MASGAVAWKREAPPSPTGYTRLLCRGRCVMGPDASNVMWTGAMIMVPATLFLTLVVPSAQNSLYDLLLPTTVILMALSLCLLVVTATTDPGFLPHADEEESPVAPPPDPRTGDPWKYCTTCNVFRPPRAKHCRMCNNCVVKFDHHCPWVGNCIAVRNYKPFFGFLLFTTLLSAVTAATAAFRVAVRVFHVEPSPAWGFSELVSTPFDDVSTYLLGLYALVLFFPVAFMLLSHSYLMATNQTTAEFLKRRRSAHGRNPYTHGCVSNCAHAWCSDVPASQLNAVEPSQAVVMTAPGVLDAVAVTDWRSSSPPLPPLPTARMSPARNLDLIGVQLA